MTEPFRFSGGGEAPDRRTAYRFSGGGQAPNRYFSGGGEADRSTAFRFSGQGEADRSTAYRFSGGGEAPDRATAFRFSGKGSVAFDPWVTKQKTGNLLLRERYLSTETGSNPFTEGRHPDGSYTQAFILKQYNNISDPSFKKLVDKAYDPNNPYSFSLRVNKGRVEMFVGENPRIFSVANKLDTYLWNNIGDLPFVGSTQIGALYGEVQTHVDKAGVDPFPGLLDYVKLLNQVAKENNVHTVYGHLAGASVVQMMDDEYSKVGIDGSFSHSLADQMEETKWYKQPFQQGQRNNDFLNLLSDEGDTWYSYLYGANVTGKWTSITGNEAFFDYDKPSAEIIGEGLSEGVLQEVLSNFDWREYATDPEFLQSLIG